MVQQLSNEDHRRRLDFCLQLQDLISSNDHFLEKVQLSDEATFHVIGAVNRRNVRIWGSEKPTCLSWRSWSQCVFVHFPVKRCTVHSSLLKKPLLTWHIWTCCNCGKYHSCKMYLLSYSSRPLPLWDSSVPEHSFTRTLDRTCVWKWPTTDALAPEVSWHYALWFFSLGICQRPFVPPLPRDLADLKARIIAAVKNIDAPILTRVWQELEYRIDVWRFPVAVINSIKVGPLLFLL